MEEPQPYFIDIVLGASMITLKACALPASPRGPGEVLAWEVRRLNPLLPYKEEQTKKILDDFGEMWQDYMSDAGVSMAMDLFPSQRSFRALHPGAAVPVWVREETAMTANGLMAVLVGIATRYKSHQGRAHTSGALRELLCRFQMEGLTGLVQPGRMPAAVKAACAVGADGVGGVCEHMQDLLAHCLNKEDQTPEACLCECLVRMVQSREVCAAAAAWYQHSLRALAVKFDARAKVIGSSDPRSASALVLHGPKKRKRTDEDLRRVIVEQRGKTKTPQGWARATGEASESTAANWMGAYMGEVRAAIFMSFDGAQHVALAWDAGRFGSPKEETVTVAAAVVEKGLAAWLAPQVERQKGPKGFRPKADSWLGMVWGE